MSLIDWQDAFSIGVPSVDYEHQEMIGLINDLYAKLQGRESKVAIGNFLGEVYVRISAHFALEERLMQDTGYDQYPAHKADHEQLLDEIRDIMDRHESDGYVDLEHELADHLKSWFVNHFRTMDARLHGVLG